MLTVPEAARRVGRNPETVRRWIRAGRLPARKVGTQHVIEEADLDAMFDDDIPAPVPKEWGWDVTRHGNPMPNFIPALREVRGER